jgi:PAS domain S-box-containing protein
LAEKWHFANWSLRNKLAVLIVIVSLIPLAIATCLGIRWQRELLLAKTTDLLRSNASQLVSELDSYISGYQHIAERLARAPDLVHLMQAPDANRSDGPSAAITNAHDMLRLLPSSDRHVITTAVLDLQGRVIAASSPGIEGSRLPAYVDPSRQRTGPELRVSEASLGSQPAVVFVASVPDGERSAGVAVIWVRADGIWDLMKKSNGHAGPGSRAVLLDQSGIRIGHSVDDQMLFHPAATLDDTTRRAMIDDQRFGARTAELLNATLEFPEIYAHATDTTTDAEPFDGVSPFNRAANIGVARRLDSTGWTVVYLVPGDIVMASLSQVSRRAVLLAGSIMLLALVAGTLFSAGILAPLRSLSRATELITGGDLGARAQIARFDELGQLGASFNAMAARLEDQSRLLQRSHDQLELRVQERTAALASAMETLEQVANERARVQQLLKGIVDSTDDAIISKTIDGIILTWNPAAERLFGYSEAQAVGQSMRMLLPPERIVEEETILRRIARGESIEHLETVRVRSDGRRLDISATISPVRDSEGRSVGASQIARDIGERKASERRLRAQLEQLFLLSQITRAIAQRQDLTSIFQVVLATLESQLPIDFGCFCTYDAVAKTLSVTIPGLNSREHARSLQLEAGSMLPVDANNLSSCLRGRLIYEPDSSKVDCPLGRTMTASGMNSFLIAPLAVDADVFGVLIAARESIDGFSSGECEFLKQVSEHTALALQQATLYTALQAAYDDLRQTQAVVMQQERLRALGQMASGIAHDINNALSPAALYVQSLLETEPNLSDDAREQLATIERSIVDVSKTVARMRQFYRPRDAVAVSLPVDLNSLIPHIVELTRARWSTIPQERGVVVRVNTTLAGDLPLFFGAENEIADAITNLIVNAVDAMPDGGELTVATRVIRTGESCTGGMVEREAVCLEVSDTGVGMDEATRSRCLEPFFTTKGERGTGLGLAMVYGMSIRHDAQLDIDSVPGRGTTMRLTFANLCRETLERTQTSLPAIRALHILVVEDDPVILQTVQRILQHDGHTVVAAEGGQAGVDAFTQARCAERPFDIVITDLGMPVVDGRQVAAAVKRVDATTPVILLTGWGQRLLDDKELPMHVDRVLSKPPQLSQLRLALLELDAHSCSGRSALHDMSNVS